MFINDIVSIWGEPDTERSLARVLRLSVIILAFFLFGSPAAAEELTGIANVIDGDSLRLNGVELRLVGIDAPEGRQTCNVGGRAWRCGRAAAETLGMLVQSRPIRCTFSEHDRYKRGLATCFRDDMNINAMMIELGMALPYLDQGQNYLAEEKAAREQRRGLWDATFTPPWEWRRQQRARDEDGPDCPVKGNVNRRGQKIYHARGWRDYARVRLNADEGDRCFQTTAAAAAAGFRAARQ